MALKDERGFRGLPPSTYRTKESRSHFYWDDEVLGDQPGKEKLGLYKGRETILKENEDGFPIVQYIDNNEICELQTAAFFAMKAGYSNISEFLIDNLAILLPNGVGEVVEAEINYHEENSGVLLEDNTRLSEESFVNYQREERQQLALIYAAGTLGFTEQQSEAWYQECLRLRKLLGDEVNYNTTEVVGTYDELEDFGSWLYPDDGETIH